MKLPVVLVGEDSLALASLKQQLEREPSVSIEPKIYGYGEAFEGLKTRNAPVIAVVDINLDPERAFQVAEQIKLRLNNVRLVMTSPTGAPETILRAMRSGAEEFLTQPFNWTEVSQIVGYDPQENRRSYHKISRTRTYYRCFFEQGRGRFNHRGNQFGRMSCGAK